ncbi:hypothetical protein V8F20_007333 [Naviculisporaceae sp. PSN 640]
MYPEFTITANPDTDIWRKPPHIDVFNAPTASSPGKQSPSSGPLSKFRFAQVTFDLPYKYQYDQAGILLSFRPTSPSSSSSSTSSPSSSPPRWIKTGVEYYNGTAMLSTVSCYKWADWSVSPLHSGFSPIERYETTIRIERVDGQEGQEKGASLWVYYIKPGGERKALREICWVYEDGDGSSDDWTLEVKAMAARPSKTATEPLEVEFYDVEFAWAD